MRIQISNDQHCCRDEDEDVFGTHMETMNDQKKNQYFERDKN